MKGRSWYQEEDVAEGYEEARFSGKGGASIHRRETETLLSMLGDVEGKRVLEIATGTGRFAERLKELGADVTAVDISREMMGQGYERAGGIFARADASQLPFRDDTFDVVIAVRFLHLMPEPEPFIREMARVSGGEVIFDTFNLKSGRILYNRLLPMGSRLYSEDRVLELVEEAGMEKVRRRDEFFIPFGAYRAAPDFLAGPMEAVDEAITNTPPGRWFASVSYWKSSV